MIKMETSMGDIVIELDFDKAPKSAENFQQYVEDGFYDGLIFHRVISSFMVQGGGMDENMKEKATREPIENEANNGVKNDCYTLAMARTMDPHSASSQFFINVKDNAFLNFSSEPPQGWESRRNRHATRARPGGERSSHGWQSRVARRVCCWCCW